MVTFNIILPNPLRYHGVCLTQYNKKTDVPEDVRISIENYLDELLKY